ncbi:FAST kinase domain-containing protein 5, mitochondrial [Camelus ferus]|uniref:FAST kinase domain-containing protein 5, mitochondrial n=4 Tax=Camelus TaxID=9836 RepID=A0A8B7KDL0_CAMFR|nr:FAST kinase domain-containing protein 5, mitochondrial [Camelus ferus]XP_031289959.1 FAST kinase domain-containing protein 5, mitochondrial [Camelus dromedarius]XP_031289960.1 FAST kinase domain-containing protein 5, mitochondrial [Camelus dromedarius]XP_031289961.1 FAST kinase domain-containing protein 5, mitochondrial [Camelus dromedarius]XP_032317835.1 FAST kinase domain-containing protein 5, mitochondrial [Camelus ferus]XP_032317836.1 FAST kinase domain-containing protein 5, mitochondri
MALVICRRFPGSFCGMPSCPALIKHHINKKLLDQTCEDCVLTAKMINTDTRMAANLKLLKPLGYQAFCSPFACSATRSVACWSMGSCTWHKRQDLPEKSLCHPAKKVNIYNTSTSWRILTTSSTFLGLEFSRASASKVSTLKPGSPRAMRVNEEDVEAFDSFEDPRVFLQLRPEYQLHSYNRSETCQPLSVSEGELILHKVTVYQDNLQPQTIVDYFCKLSSLPAEQHPVLLSSASFALLCQLSVKNIQLFDAPDLISILKAFVSLRIPHSHSMLDVFETKFCHKVWEMSLDQLLLVADLWRCLGRRVPRFLKIFFSYLNLHWKDLSLSQLIHLIYIIGESRQVPQDLMQKLESLILKYIDLINVEEFGTICLGFFKSSSGLSEFVMRKIGDLACADMHDLSSYALVNILKMFRFTHVDHVNFMKQFGQIAPQRIPSLGVQGVMHLTLACSALHILDEGIMNAVAASLPPRVAYCRSKDVAKILWSFGTLNYKPPNTEEFYSSLINEIHRKMPEFNRYPEHLLTCLLGLAFSEYFPADLIDFALSPEFVKLAQEKSKFEVTKELYTLDGTVGIECPDYRGSRLSSHLQQEGLEMVWNLARKDMDSKPEFLEALFLLETMLGGPQYIKHHMILPHTRSSDLEVQLDVNMKPLPFNREATSVEDETKLRLKHVGVSLTDDLMNQLLKGKSRGHFQGETVSDTGRQPMKSEEKLAIPVADPLCNVAHRLGAMEMADLCPPACMQAPQVKLAIQLTNKNQYCYGSRNLLGLHNMKRRQLNQLGYRVVELSHWEWLPLLKRTRFEKLAFLHEKVFTSAL